MANHYTVIDNSILKNREIINRRKEQIKKQIFVFAISVSVFSIVFSVFTFNSLAKNNKQQDLNKYYKSIEISYGETLTDIAAIYNNIDQCSNENYINEVMEINNLSNDTIKSGNYLIVPYYTSEIR